MAASNSVLLQLFSLLLLFTLPPLSSPSPNIIDSSSTETCLNSSSITTSLLPSDTSNRLLKFVEETSWYNDLLFAYFFPQRLRSRVPHIVQTWLRNYIATIILYFATANIWCWYLYHYKKHVYFPQGGIPSKKQIALQIRVSMRAMPVNVCLPTLAEYMIEKGWTRCYSSISEVGLVPYIGWTLIYLVLVEFCIYWLHRGLHYFRPLYKWFHATHHIYNKENTVSPFAGFALEPLDGIIQACPHLLLISVVPIQLLTYELLLFTEVIWTTNIHDCIHGNVWPIMGAGYHTIHHTTYQHNYGHYTIWMDWWFGTLRKPSIKVGTEVKKHR